MRMVNTKIDRLHRLDRPDRLHRLDRLNSFSVYGSMAGLWRVYFDRPLESFIGLDSSNRVYGVYEVYGFIQNEIVAEFCGDFDGRVYEVYGFIQNAHFRRILNGSVYEPGLSRVYHGL